MSLEGGRCYCRMRRRGKAAPMSTVILPTARNASISRGNVVGRRSIATAACVGAAKPRLCQRSFFELSDDDRGVVAAEAEGVRQRHSDVRRIARFVRDVVEIALGVLELVVDRR